MNPFANPYIRSTTTFGDVTDPSTSSTRRRVLAGALTGAGIASAGCVGRFRNIAAREEATQVSLDLYTTPADTDPHAIRIARHVADNLETVGIQPNVSTMSETELYREVLLNHSFDLYIGQFPESDPFDPDALYPLCYSEFNSEPGWQNPFGLTNFRIDELLLEQRRASTDDRYGFVNELQREIVNHQPFTTVVFPDALTAVQESRFEGWRSARPTSPLALLQLDFVDEASGDSGDDATDTDADDGADADDDTDSDDDTGADDGTDEDDDADEDDEPDRTLRLVTTDPRITENRNPIAPEYRRHGSFTGLLYDPLVHEYGGEYIPWIARDWEWRHGGRIRLTLREMEWHDEEPITAADVAFTYEFLADTSMGNAETPIPTSRFRGRSTLVEGVEPIDERTVEITFIESNDDVAFRALTVPLLPEHVWTEQTDLVSIAGVEVNDETTDAQVWDNPEPVGSGSLRFVEAEANEHVVFERNDAHFLAGEPEGVPSEFYGKPGFDRLELETVPSDISAVERVGDRLADATASNLGPDSVPRIGREADASLVSTRSAAFYHVGYNTRGEPLSNPHFRRAIAHLIDKPSIVEDTFNGYGKPAASPMAASPDWLASDLRFKENEDPATPFLGSDGSIDEAAAREQFREIGYRYNEDGELLARDQ